jgi:hypothetical protein
MFKENQKNLPQNFVSRAQKGRTKCLKKTRKIYLKILSDFIKRNG